jgi:hypothetical protein
VEEVLAVEEDAEIAKKIKFKLLLFFNLKCQDHIKEEKFREE